MRQKLRSMCKNYLSMAELTWINSDLAAAMKECINERMNQRKNAMYTHYTDTPAVFYQPRRSDCNRSNSCRWRISAHALWAVESACTWALSAGSTICRCWNTVGPSVVPRHGTIIRWVCEWVGVTNIAPVNPPEALVWEHEWLVADVELHCASQCCPWASVPETGFYCHGAPGWVRHAAFVVVDPDHGVVDVPSVCTHQHDQIHACKFQGFNLL